MNGVVEKVWFRSGDVRCAGTFYRPPGGDRHPVVVMGNGLGGVQDIALAPYAAAFMAGGLAALTFDYRCFGESEGHPRQHFSIAAQLADWRAAIAYAAGHPAVDPRRIALWGTSFGGSHVLTLAAAHPDIAAAVAQCPNVDFRATVLRTPPSHLLRLVMAGLADTLSRRSGRGSRPVPLVGPPTSRALMTTPDAQINYPLMAAGSATWANSVTPGFLLGLALYRPVRRVAKIRSPLLVQVCGRDGIADPIAAHAAAVRAPEGRAELYDCDHFEIYAEPHRSRAIAGQLAFLTAMLAPVAPCLGSPAAVGAGRGGSG